MNCSFGDGKAFIIVTLSDGCIGIPYHRMQGLCLQHYYSMTPRGSSRILKILDKPLYDWYISTR